MEDVHGHVAVGHPNHPARRRERWLLAQVLGTQGGRIGVLQQSVTLADRRELRPEVVDPADESVVVVHADLSEWSGQASLVLADVRQGLQRSW
jgi:hypothetical protein